MKRFLLALFLLVITHSAYSQVVDIVGKGVKGQAKSNLLIPNIENVDSVEVGAFYKGGETAPPLNHVLFETYKGNPSSKFNDDIITKLSHNGPPQEYIGYFSKSFESVDESGIDISIIPTNYVHSFYSYIYRNDLTSEFKSYTDLSPTFYYHNGAANPHIYNVKIPKSESNRQVKVKIPISELDNSPRMVVIKITAGSVSFETQEYTWNFDLGNSFFIGEYLLKNISGEVDMVSVSIHSPNNSNGEENGDSFFVSGIVVDVEKTGCTYTQGYWKNHSECKKNGNGPKRDDTWDYIGEDSIFFKSGLSYCDVFATQPSNKNGKYYILAHQYIATELNLYNSADPTDVAEYFKEATDFLEKYTPEDVRNSKDLQSTAVKLGGKLDEYNNGKTGPGHCDDDNDDDHDDDDDDDEKEAYIERIFIKERAKKDKIKIFPNPVTNNGQILFRTMNSGNTSIELYNLNGQKVSDLYKGTTKKGTDVSIPFSTVNLNKGLYFAIIKNGNEVFRHKISVSD